MVRLSVGGTRSGGPDTTTDAITRISILLGWSSRISRADRGYDLPVPDESRDVRSRLAVAARHASSRFRGRLGTVLPDPDAGRRFTRRRRPGSAVHRNVSLHVLWWRIPPDPSATPLSSPRRGIRPHLRVLGIHPLGRAGFRGSCAGVR